jgi:hypothetical protein
MIREYVILGLSSWHRGANGLSNSVPDRLVRSTEKGRNRWVVGTLLALRTPHQGRPISSFASLGGFVIRSPVANLRFRLFLGSSAVEHSTVNRMVAGSNPARGAIRLLLPNFQNRSSFSKARYRALFRWMSVSRVGAGLDEPSTLPLHMTAGWACGAPTAAASLRPLALRLEQAAPSAKRLSQVGAYVVQGHRGRADAGD